MKIKLTLIGLAFFQLGFSQFEDIESKLIKASTLKDFGLKSYIYLSKYNWSIFGVDVFNKK